VKTHFVDLAQRAASPGELRRFAQKFGTDALVDRDGKRFEALGLAHAHLSDARWLDKLADDPLLLRTPLVRNGNLLTVGEAEATWREWCGK
jgi:arsenate reductase (glutaredoxin)